MTNYFETYLKLGGLEMDFHGCQYTVDSVSELLGHWYLLVVFENLVTIVLFPAGSPAP